MSGTNTGDGSPFIPSDYSTGYSNEQPDYPINDRRNPNYIQNQAIGRYLEGRKTHGTPTGQPDKEGSDKNVGNPDTTLDKILLEVYFTTSVTGKDIAIAKAKAAIEANTAKAVREELERLISENISTVGETTIIHILPVLNRIEQLKQEGGDSAA